MQMIPIESMDPSRAQTNHQFFGVNGEKGGSEYRDHGTSFGLDQVMVQTKQVED